ncbi:DUF6455 family protein [Anianabacter salinae]|uniref:DUF6455 family protein n=1 Tax=Anianabacter salinae TaxID=2851023 RepID=UPI00225E687F|nr:DUF6455 family protein [Anianabacter salinae]MBV0912647.1 adenylosuccinate lyase [Anianabacter salinae]
MTRLADHAHDCLMQGMADKLGVVADRAPDVEAMVTRCRACVKHDACILWMLDHPRAEAAPGYCLNAEDLLALRP